MGHWHAAANALRFRFVRQTKLTAALWAGIDLLLPPRCPACGEIVAADGGFCQPCWSGLRFLTPPLCALCGEPFETPQAPDARCAACLTRPPRFAAARAALAYDGPARDVVLALKHADREHLAAAMAGQLARAGADWLDDADTIIVPVPLHRWRLWRRGYNQAALLAAGLAKRTGRPLAIDALQRHRATRISQGLDPSQRRANLRSAFRLRAKAQPVIAGRSVILVDDVFTTGATAEACTKVLLTGGARTVRVLTLARVVRDERPGHI